MKPPEITINYKPLKKPGEMKRITSSKDAEEVFRELWTDKIEYLEEVYLLALNRCHNILGYVKLSQGGTAGTVVDAKIIFQVALKTNAHGIILCHNHPSGNLNPSTDDINLTKRIKEAGALMDITLLDHLILTAENYYSFADEGLL